MRKLAKIGTFLTVLALLWACNRSGMRIKTAKPDEDRKENLKEAAKDTTPAAPKVDTLSRDVQLLKEEQFNFLTNLIINNMVRAQQAAYDGRYTEAEKLLLQALKWHVTPDALMLLGSVYEVQGDARKADSCWAEAALIDPQLAARTADIPRQREEKRNTRKK